MSLSICLCVVLFEIKYEFCFVLLISWQGNPPTKVQNSNSAKRFFLHRVGMCESFALVFSMICRCGHSPSIKFVFEFGTFVSIIWITLTDTIETTDTCKRISFFFGLINERFTNLRVPEIRAS